jgi:hypothetical protein
MFTDFQQEYAKLSNDELLQLASDRESLTADAKAALNAEMHSRGLTASDLAKQQGFVKKSKQRETKRRNAKLFGRHRSRQDWVETVVAFLLVGLFVMAYFALPVRYRFSHDWQETAFYVMLSTVLTAVTIRAWSRKLWFWISLSLSGTAQALIVHAWIVRVGTLDGWGHRGDRRLAALLGFVLFLAVYGCGILLYQRAYGDQESAESG